MECPGRRMELEALLKCVFNHWADLSPADRPLWPVGRPGLGARVLESR